MNDVLTFHRELSSAIGAVWDRWTTVDGLAQWWWPQLPDTEYVIDARVGGRYRIGSAAAGFAVRGEFLEVTAPRRLVLTWEWIDEDGAAAPDTVKVGLEPSGDRTALTVEHSLSNPASGDDYRTGWADVLDRLVALPAR